MLADWRPRPVKARRRRKPIDPAAVREPDLALLVGEIASIQLVAGGLGLIVVGLLAFIRLRWLAFAVRWTAAGFATAMVIQHAPWSRGGWLILFVYAMWRAGRISAVGPTFVAPWRWRSVRGTRSTKPAVRASGTGPG